MCWAWQNHGAMTGQVSIPMCVKILWIFEMGGEWWCDKGVMILVDAFHIARTPLDIGKAQNCTYMLLSGNKFQCRYL